MKLVLLSLSAFLLAIDSTCLAEKVPVMEERRDLMCTARKYGIEKMENRKLQNDFCMEHAARTCCDHHDTKRLKAMFQTL